MTIAIRCSRCNRRFRDGERAWEQELKVIKVRGKEVKFENQKVLVCDACVEEDQ